MTPNAETDSAGRGRGARYRYLDVLRGIAVLGILPANIPYFSMPLLAADAQTGEFASSADLVAFHATRFFVDYKFITLFSLLFGVGMGILHAKATQRGASFNGLMLRRLVALGVFGGLHVVLLWYGDILIYYAVFGMATFWFVSREPRRLFRVGVFLILVPVVVMALAAGALAVVERIPEFRTELASDAASSAAEVQLFVQQARDGTWGEFLEAVITFHPEVESTIYREGSFVKIVVMRVVSWIVGIIFVGMYIGWRIVGLFLIGMAWARAGWFLEPAENSGAFRRMLRLGLVVGLPLQVVSSVLFQSAGDSMALHVLAELAQYTGSLGFAAVYAALIGLACAGDVPRACKPFEAVGRLAFSNYILQSLICTTIFYSYGLAWFGQLSRAQLWFIVPIVWAIALVWSWAWMQRFRMGPLEALWRRITYGTRVGRN